MDRIENPWIHRQPDQTVDFTLYCDNPKCNQYGLEKVRSGIYEPDTGWGEPDDPECNECGEVMQTWPPLELDAAMEAAGFPVDGEGFLIQKGDEDE